MLDVFYFGFQYLCSCHNVICWYPLEHVVGNSSDRRRDDSTQNGRSRSVYEGHAAEGLPRVAIEPCEDGLDRCIF